MTGIESTILLLKMNGVKDFSGSSYECFSSSKKGVLNLVDRSINVLNHPYIKTIESYNRINAFLKPYFLGYSFYRGTLL